ncbi:hypothetical protein ACH5RR_007330 [Cinchona calisaya]|uniref:Uncharacterized protein n=1 Tax=Cinchona calisaya TaxID=153742 RepID=A0ABD3ARY7_9GENT
MNHLTVETEDVFASVLRLAANNDIEGFKRWAERDPSSIGEAGMWYGRQKGSKQMVLEERTPLMSPALHCAASGGSVKAIEVVRMLLAAVSMMSPSPFTPPSMSPSQPNVPGRAAAPASS